MRKTLAQDIYREGGERHLQKREREREREEKEREGERERERDWK